ncbi:MAG: protein kinase [Streptomyces sp.]|nr:protein kinase [Streptomyces sp.]
MDVSGVVLADRYRLKRLLGRGGMGEVWLGRDQSVLRREVAVKLLPTWSDADAVRRFQREAETLASLQHPGLTVVHDAGRHEGYLYIVMELLRGGDLSQVMADHPRGLPVERVLDLSAQTVAALAAAHQCGVIHRDLKPANLFVQPGDRVKICDFGIARTANATGTITMAGHVIGTPPYMSPEQCRDEPLSTSSDLYSLGCVMFEMLTGRPPFAPDLSFYNLMRLHVEQPAPHTLRPDIPDWLEDLVQALLAKAPHDRPDAHTLTTQLAQPGVPPSRARSTRQHTVNGPPQTLRGELRRTLTTHALVRSIAFSPDGRTLAAGTGKQIVLWDTATGQTRLTLTRHGLLANVLGVAFSPDGRTLASASDGQMLLLWDTGTGDKRRALRHGLMRMLRCVAFSPDGRTLAVGADNGVHLWDPTTGQRGAWLRFPRPPGIDSLAFGPDSRSLAVTSGPRNRIRVWDTRTGLELHTNNPDLAMSVAFSPDGRTLAGSYRDPLAPPGQIRLWDAHSGAVLHTLSGHTNHLYSLTFSPDGRTLAVGADNGVHLWNAHTGEPLVTLIGHTNAVRTVAFSPDGRTLASAGGDNLVHLWTITT